MLSQSVAPDEPWGTGRSRGVERGIDVHGVAVTTQVLDCLPGAPCAVALGFGDVRTRTELACGLAKRPYDLRHAGISFWLHSGVDPAECARRAGQSIEVLFRHYAKFLGDVREQANRLIEQSMQEWDRVSQGGAPAG